MRYLFFFLFCLYFLSVHAQIPFTPADTSFIGNKLIVPPGMRFDVVFRQGEIVINSQGKKGPSKDNHDYSCFFPDKKIPDQGLMYVSHESNDTSALHGDGGGATVFEVKKIDKVWVNSGGYYSVDFSNVGGTFFNCGGARTASGNVLTAEEYPPNSNIALYKEGKGFKDTSDFNGLKRWHNMGWMTEVDPVSRKAVRKLYQMGRYSHEGAQVMPDNKTVYLTDDFSPSVFFKFVAAKAGDFTSGQLYAYRQSQDGRSGSWLELPMEMDSLLVIRDVALRMGATVFVRMEWITLAKGKLYISETGMDNFVLNEKNIYNGTPAKHVRDLYHQGNDRYDYPYGSVMEFDPATNIMRPLIAGGQGKKFPDKHFSNPDGITFAEIKGKTWLVINEDIIGLTKDRVSEEAFKANRYINEIWWLDLSIANPQVDDLHRFLVAPAGAETTGGVFTPDYKTYFVNIQHPDSNNPVPFNRSATIAISPVWTEGKKKR